jgi:hypothetical protein
MSCRLSICFYGDYASKASSECSSRSARAVERRPSAGAGRPGEKAGARCRNADGGVNRGAPRWPRRGMTERLNASPRRLWEDRERRQTLSNQAAEKGPLAGRRRVREDREKRQPPPLAVGAIAHRAARVAFRRRQQKPLVIHTATRRGDRSEKRDERAETPPSPQPRPPSAPPR